MATHHAESDGAPQSTTTDQVLSPLDWIHLSPGGAAKPAACVDFHVRAWLCSSYLCDGDLSFDDPCQTFAPPSMLQSELPIEEPRQTPQMARHSQARHGNE